MTDEPRDPSAPGGDDAETAPLDAAVLEEIRAQLAAVEPPRSERRSAQLAAALAAYDRGVVSESAPSAVDLAAEHARRRPDLRVWLGRVAAAAVVVFAGAVGIRLATTSDDATQTAGDARAEVDTSDGATASKSADESAASVATPELEAGNVAPDPAADAADAAAAGALPATGAAPSTDDLGAFATTTELAAAIHARDASPLTTLAPTAVPPVFPTVADQTSEGGDADATSRAAADPCRTETAALATPRYWATVAGAPVVAAPRLDGDGVDVVRLDDCSVTVVGGR